MNWILEEYRKVEEEERSLEQTPKLVCCPVCQGGFLRVATERILVTCTRCPIRLYTSSSLEQIEAILNQTLNEHATYCHGNPQFSVVNEPNSNSSGLFVICGTCSLFDSLNWDWPLVAFIFRLFISSARAPPAPFSLPNLVQVGRAPSGYRTSFTTPMRRMVDWSRTAIALCLYFTISKPSYTLVASVADARVRVLCTTCAGFSARKDLNKISFFRPQSCTFVIYSYSIYRRLGAGRQLRPRRVSTCRANRFQFI